MKIREFITNVRDWSEEQLRTLFGRMTPDRRVILVAAMFLLFAAGSIYITASSIYNFGREKGERMQIERIEALKIRQDSINRLNNQHYGTREEE